MQREPRSTHASDAVSSAKDSRTSHSRASSASHSSSVSENAPLNTATTTMGPPAALSAPELTDALPTMASAISGAAAAAGSSAVMAGGVGSRSSSVGSITRESTDYHSLSSPVLTNTSANEAVTATITEQTVSALTEAYSRYPSPTATAAAAALTAAGRRAVRSGDRGGGHPLAVMSMPPCAGGGDLTHVVTSAANAARRLRRANSGSGGGGGDANWGEVEGNEEGEDVTSRHRNLHEREEPQQQNCSEDAGDPRLHYELLQDASPVCTAATASATEWVLLNVGGQLMTTTVGTLLADPNSVLAALCGCLARPRATRPLPPPSPPVVQSPFSSPSAGAARSRGDSTLTGSALRSGSGAAEHTGLHRDPVHSIGGAMASSSSTTRATTASSAGTAGATTVQRSSDGDAQTRVGQPPPPLLTRLTEHPARAANADGEAVSPQQAVSPVPLDTDRDNAILLDLDAEYFTPVLNYLRHGAVMIPRGVDAEGVLAMAEYLNVAGLVRLLRGPPMPRRVLLFSWGSGSNGELGTHAVRDEVTPTMAQVTPFGVRVKEIALGANYSCALTDTGHIYTFGNGEWGQLGLGGGNNGGLRAGAGVGSGGGGAAASSPDGSTAEVPVELLIPRRVPLFEQVPAVHVAAGYAFAMAIVEQHHVYFWGNNNHGQSGRGRAFFDAHSKKVDAPVLVETLEGKRIVQLSCGSFFALALSEDGALYSWGLVDCVGLGTPEEVERRYHAVLGASLSNERRSVVLTPQLVTVRGRRRVGSKEGPAPERLVRIRAGQWHSGAINEQGELFTWGVGYQGRLGHGSKSPAYVPTLVQGVLEGQKVVDVACGSFHTVALTADGDVFCWGDNASGQCGTTANSPDAFTAPYRVLGLEYVAGGIARSIACGRQHTVVVMEGPHPWCMEPCCQAARQGTKAGTSHAQVYCFGEVTRGTAGGPVGSSASAGPAGGRGSAGGTHGMGSTAGLAPGALPGPSSLTAALGMTGAAGASFSGRSLLPGTGGHHHPHYQLVSGMQGLHVHAVVSGLHHTFVFAEELQVVEEARSNGYTGQRLSGSHGLNGVARHRAAVPVCLRSLSVAQVQSFSGQYRRDASPNAGFTVQRGLRLSPSL